MRNFFLFFILVSSVFVAAQVKAFSISPLKFITTVAPGDNKDWEVKVKNDSNKSSVFAPVVLGMKQDEIGRSVFGKNIDVAESWFKIPFGKLVLNPGESGDVVFSISVPANTPPGAHYVGLAVQEESTGSVTGQLATVLNLQVAGMAQELVIFEKFSVGKKIFFDKDWISHVEIRNRGNVSVDLAGQESVYFFGKKKFSKVVNLGNNLFSQTNRVTDENLFFEQDIILPGFYRVDMDVVFGLTKHQVSSSLNFWYLPWWFLMSVVLGVLIVVFFIFKKKRNVAT